MNYDKARACAATISKKGSILGLTSIQNLMQELSHVEEQLQIIHIAGTNGKGSVGAFLESVLMEAGYKVGRYTSPAVFDPLEVWRINQKNIEKERYAELFSKVKEACDRMVEKGMPHPTIFEVETAMAFCYFKEECCDYVLLEVGMGGREDATNLISHPVCSVLTSISMDHMQFLGDTIGQIAWAKAGIIKASCPAVTAGQERYGEEVLSVIRKEAEEKHAPLWIAKASEVKLTENSLQEIRFLEPEMGEVSLPLTGAYQIENAHLAITVLRQVLKLDTDVIKRGLTKTRWPGRFEQIAADPLFLIDGAHNEDAAVKLEASVENYFTNRKITYIIGVLADKEHAKVLERMLPHASAVYTVTPDNPRALDAKKLAKEARLVLDKLQGGNNPQEHRPQVQACETVREAVERAWSVTPEDGVILAFGSLSYLKDVKKEMQDGSK